MSQHVDLGDGVLEAQYASRGPASGRKWYTCVICGLDFPQDKVVIRGGAAYCTESCSDELRRS